MPTPKTITISDRIFKKLLRLYPQPYRRDFGELMAQLFRDQCRAARQRGGYAGLLKLWLRTLPDLGKTALIEQLNQTKRNPMNVKQTPTLLLVAALFLGLVSLTPMVMPYHNVFMLLVMASALGALAKAGVELSRPANEWPMVLLRTFILMISFGFFLPAWGRKSMHEAVIAPGGHNPLAIFIMICLMANPLVTVIKVGQFLMQRLKR